LRLLIFFIGIVMLFINIIFRDDYAQFACLSVCLSVYGPLDDAVTLPLDSGTDLGVDANQFHHETTLNHSSDVIIPNIQPTSVAYVCPSFRETHFILFLILNICRKLIPNLLLTRNRRFIYWKRCYPSVFLRYLFT